MQAKCLRYGYKYHGPGGPALLGAALLLMLAAPLVLAGKPDCPDHPSCGYHYTLQDARAGFYYCDGDPLSCVELEEASPWNGPYGDADHEWGPEYNDWTENTLTLDEIPRPSGRETAEHMSENYDDDELILSELPDDELVEQMHDDLYDGLADEIAEGTQILLDRGWKRPGCWKRRWSPG